MPAVRSLCMAADSLYMMFRIGRNSGSTFRGLQRVAEHLVSGWKVLDALVRLLVYVARSTRLIVDVDKIILAMKEGSIVGDDASLTPRTCHAVPLTTFRLLRRLSRPLSAPWRCWLSSPLLRQVQCLKPAPNPALQEPQDQLLSPAETIPGSRLTCPLLPCRPQPELCSLQGQGTRPQDRRPGLRPGQSLLL